MSLKITLNLEDKDLGYFRQIMAKAHGNTVKKKSEAEIIRKAEEALLQAVSKKTPAFVQDRLKKLRSMLEMLTDEEWQFSKKERENVLSALAYFVEPADLIHDEIPVLGFLDDAIMIELVVRELQHEVGAYRDFCKYRDDISKAKGADTLKTRKAWLSNKRAQLHTRMRRRRLRMHQRLRRNHESRLRVGLF